VVITRRCVSRCKCQFLRSFQPLRFRARNDSLSFFPSSPSLASPGPLLVLRDRKKDHREGRGIRIRRATSAERARYLVGVFCEDMEGRREEETDRGGRIPNSVSFPGHLADSPRGSGPAVNLQRATRFSSCLPGSPNISQAERVNKSARCRGEELLAAIMATAIIDRTFVCFLFERDTRD